MKHATENQPVSFPYQCLLCLAPYPCKGGREGKLYS